MSQPSIRRAKPMIDREEPGREQPGAEPVRKKRVYAGPCPRNAEHAATRVYRTDGQVRYCVCDDCGETWKKTGPRSDEEHAEA